MNNIRFLILVIEDENDLRDSVCELIEHFGYEAISAATGVEGLRLILERTPDVVLCDIMLPDIDGYELMRRIKEIPHTVFNNKVNLLSSIAFIFLSAKATHSDIRIGMNLGADDYICKPFSSDELLNCIRARLDKLQKIRKAQINDLSLDAINPEFVDRELQALTKKEARIFDLIALGYTSEEIARILFLSRRTIENHRGNISRKLKLQGPKSLISYAIRSRMAKSIN